MMIRTCLLTFLCFLGFQLFGQGNHNLHLLTDPLNLSEVQVEEWKTMDRIFQVETNVKLLPFKNSSEKPSKELLQSINQEYEDNLADILTTEQHAEMLRIYDENKQKLDSRRKSTKKSKQPSKRNELAAFKEASLIPLIVQLREKFEGKISDTDKLEINRIRAIRSKIVKEKLEANQVVGADGSKKQNSKVAGLYYFASMPVPNMKSLREQYPSDYEKLNSLKEKYSEEIQAVVNEGGEEISDYFMVKGLKETYGHIKKRSGGPKSQASILKKLELYHQFFMVLEPDEVQDHLKTKKKLTPTHKVIVHPNKENHLTIEIDLAKISKVDIEIVDKAENKLAKVCSKILMNGEQEINTSVSMLENGVYFLRLTDSSGTSLTEFKVEK